MNSYAPFLQSTRLLDQVHETVIFNYYSYKI